MKEFKGKEELFAHFGHSDYGMRRNHLNDNKYIDYKNKKWYIIDHTRGTSPGKTPTNLIEVRPHGDHKFQERIFFVGVKENGDPSLENWEKFVQYRITTVEEDQASKELGSKIKFHIPITMPIPLIKA